LVVHAVFPLLARPFDAMSCPEHMPKLPYAATAVSEVCGTVPDERKIIV